MHSPIAKIAAAGALATSAPLALAHAEHSLSATFSHLLSEPHHLLVVGAAAVAVLAIKIALRPKAKVAQPVITTK